jgi:hypothetical protein
MTTCPELAAPNARAILLFKYVLPSDQKRLGLVFDRLRLRTTMVRAKWMLVLVAALLSTGLVSTGVQCVLGCAGISGTAPVRSSSLPPCHQHHDQAHQQSPSSCAHQVVSAQSTAPQHVQVGIPAPLSFDEPVAPHSAGVSPVRMSAPALENVSPPGLSVVSSIILRI